MIVCMSVCVDKLLSYLLNGQYTLQQFECIA